MKYLILTAFLLPIALSGTLALAHGPGMRSASVVAPWKAACR